MMAQGVFPRAALTLAIVCAWYCGIQGVFAKEKSEIKKSTRLPLLLAAAAGEAKVCGGNLQYTWEEMPGFICCLESL